TATLESEDGESRRPSVTDEHEPPLFGRHAGERFVEPLQTPVPLGKLMAGEEHQPQLDGSFGFGTEDSLAPARFIAGCAAVAAHEGFGRDDDGGGDARQSPRRLLDEACGRRLNLDAITASGA